MPNLTSLTVGEALPERDYVASNVSLFMYNAAIWNAHRIHYDEPYTTGVEKHPGVIIDGPLQGDWLTQVVLDWLADDGQLLEFEYSNRSASILGQALTAGGRVKSISDDNVGIELYVHNEAGEIVTPGSALVKLSG
jgi:hydroxyacyl-ACP dehydratase HTD2-like protein with hotdog domain